MKLAINALIIAKMIVIRINPTTHVLLRLTGDLKKQLINENQMVV